MIRKQVKGKRGGPAKNGPILYNAPVKEVAHFE